MENTANQPEPTECLWCGYDTAASGAARCAECGADLNDRERITRLLEIKSGLWAMCLVMMVACFLLTTAWFQTERGGVHILGVFGAVAVGVVVACLCSGFRVWRGLGEHGRTYPQRRSALLCLLAFMGQLAVLAFFQVVAILVLWRP